MKQMFQNARSFNQPLNKWNVSNVKNMRWMFSDAESFNQPLNNWEHLIHDDTDFMGFFDGASSFNQPLHAPWY